MFEQFVRSISGFADIIMPAYSLLLHKIEISVET